VKKGTLPRVIDEILDKDTAENAIFSIGVISERLLFAKIETFTISE